MIISLDDISKLAPDDTTNNRAKSLMHLSKWNNIAKLDNFIWGESTASVSEPHFVKIILDRSIYSCSCQDKIKPCKHILGLLYLYASDSIIENANPPKWVTDWIEKNNYSNSNSVKTENTIDKLSHSKNTVEKKVDEKRALMLRGMEELEFWLLDITNQGLSNFRINDPKWWEQSAAKFKDAKLSRISNRIREIGDIINSKTDWIHELTHRIGELWLLLKAFYKIDSFENDFQEEILNNLGRIVKKSELLESGNFQIDKWLVLSIKEEDALDNLLERRVWIQGLHSKKLLLIQDFKFVANVDFEENYKVSEIFEAKVYYYPAAYFQRVVLTEKIKTEPILKIETNAFTSFDLMLKEYSNALVLNPWLRFSPVVISECRIIIDEKENFYLIDQQNEIIPLNKNSSRSLWVLLSISGGKNITIIGEWDSTDLEILSYVENGEIKVL